MTGGRSAASRRCKAWKGLKTRNRQTRSEGERLELDLKLNLHSTAGVQCGIARHHAPRCVSTIGTHGKITERHTLNSTHQRLPRHRSGTPVLALHPALPCPVLPLRHTHTIQWPSGHMLNSSQQSHSTPLATRHCDPPSTRQQSSPARHTNAYR
ncbi:hypothetical protein NDU88_003019 [Pleurodeles waltl]|uniref:Uncharacterized protein n=1 Tax=Pleurodeles waltl TaxID=8319 RepID=A0AAV7LE65_PLEWA|nr:hypothetical protein NDU88_003019 [Pleurodeles waltl]